MLVDVVVGGSVVVVGGSVVVVGGSVVAGGSVVVVEVVVVDVDVEDVDGALTVVDPESLSLPALGSAVAEDTLAVLVIDVPAEELNGRQRRRR